MFNESPKQFVKLIILFILTLPNSAFCDEDMSIYKTLNYAGTSFCIFEALNERVVISQPRIMGYTPYIWKKSFNNNSSLGVIDGVLPDGKKIITFAVSSVSSRVSKIEAKLQDFSKSNIDVIDTIFRQLDSDSCVSK